MVEDCLIFISKPNFFAVASGLISNENVYHAKISFESISEISE